MKSHLKREKGRFHKVKLHEDVYLCGKHFSAEVIRKNYQCYIDFYFIWLELKHMLR